MKVLVVTGGNSSERAISLLSAKEVSQALVSSGYKVRVFDLNKGVDSLKKLAQDSDVIFPVLHGSQGEGGELHKVLERLGKPFVGTHYKYLQRGWYKIPFKKFCDKNKIKTARWKVINPSNEIEQIKTFGLPAVVKSSAGGSSREVVILKDVNDLKMKELQELINSGETLFVEEYLDGVEVTVGVLEDQAFPLLEIVPPQGGWFDYKNKYTGVSQEIPFAPSLTSQMQNEIAKIALNIHKLLNLGDYSRIDFIVKNGTPFVLEVNTIPGLTAESLFPKAAKAAGISFEQLTDQLVKKALSRKQ